MTACRSCGSWRLEVVLSLGDQPLANAYVRVGDLGKPESRYPLVLAVCPDCKLAQLTMSVPPSQMFTDYPYFSSVSESFVRHAGELVDRIIADRGLGPGALVMEIGSNDGYLLRRYLERGIDVLGVDPAANLAQVANERGVPTIADFFGLDLAEELRASGRRADVIHANNVIAHVPDIHGVIEGLARVLKKDGIVVIETPYVRDMVERLEFDTIYHEHVFYYSLSSLSQLLRAHSLRPIEVERVAVHGGSIRVSIVHESTGQAPGRSVSEMGQEEDALGVGTIVYFKTFAAGVETARTELRGTLSELRASGRSIAAYGAAAKGTVLLNACDIDDRIIDFVADRSQHKQGLYMPGVHIQIVPAEELARRSPDYCLLLAWNFADEVVAQQEPYRAAGGQFIVPIPTPHVLN